MNSAHDVLHFYADVSPMTSGGSHTRRLKSLPTELRALAACVQGLLVYDVVAKDFYGFEVPKSRAEEIHIRPTEKILHLAVELDDLPLTRPRPVDKRVLGRCHHFTLLAVAALRAHGVPARARCGFGAYFNPPQFEDHWVCEYWNTGEERWILADTQFDPVWIDKLHVRHDVLDVPRDQFLVAADAWQQCRAGKLDPEKFGIDFVKLRGLWFIAGSLVRDLAALNKVEMLPWDSWGAQPKPNAALTQAELQFFDHLAELTRDPDASLAALRQHHDEDERLRVPHDVFNSLKQKTERVDEIHATH